MVVVVCLTIVTGLLGPVAASSHAVIVQGWLPNEGGGLDWLPTDRDTFDELWNDCALWYQLMYDRPAIAHDTNRIHMLWGRGSDYYRRGVRYDPAWIDTVLEHLTNDSACLFTVESCFSALARESLAADDTLFCYTWGHGGLNTNSPKTAWYSSIKVRPVIWQNGGYVGTDLWDTAFARMCDPILSQRVFIMQQCRGGGFIDDLGDDRTIMVCAASAKKKAYSCDNESLNGSPLPEHETTFVVNPPNDTIDTVPWHHCEFSFHIMNALRGTTIWPYENPDKVRADTSGDSLVSWYEAFRYNEQHNTTDPDPIYCDSAYRWALKESIPRSMKSVGKGAALGATEPDSCDSTGAALWALKGNNTLEFWKYDIQEDSWMAKEPIPQVGCKPRDGATLTADNDGYLYATKGDNSHQFWLYDTLKDMWHALPEVPGKKVGKGASAAFAVVDSVPYIYLLTGNSTLQFNRFNILADTWETLACAPAGPRGARYKLGSCIAYDGDTTIYALKGRFNEFYAYKVGSGSWVPKCSLPLWGRTEVDGRKKVRAGYGAALAANGDWVYAINLKPA